MSRLLRYHVAITEGVVRKLRREEGQGTMEYVLIIAFVTVAILAILFMFRDQLTTWINQAIATISNWAT